MGGRLRPRLYVPADSVCLTYENEHPTNRTTPSQGPRMTANEDDRRANGRLVPASDNEMVAVDDGWRPGAFGLVAIFAIVLAVAGTGIASYLAYENLQGHSGVCAITHGCATVQQSSYGKLFGVPVSAPGLAMYIALGALAVAWLTDFRGLRALWTLLGFAGAVCGAVVSAYLTYIEWQVLEAWCIYCIGSALLMVTMLVTWSALFWRTRSAMLDAGDA